MRESEVIIINGIPEQVYNSIIDEAFAYGVQSIAFTYQRVSAPLHIRIANITNGKIAEGILNFFLKENGIVVDTESCKTSYEFEDKNDFLYDGIEYDTKCYKLHNQDGEILEEDLYINQPAAIMVGQYKKTPHNRTAKSTAFIFMFQRTRRNKPEFEVFIPDDVAYQIMQINSKYHKKGIEIKSKDRMQINSFPGRCQIKQNYYSHHIVTAYANLTHDEYKFKEYKASRKNPHIFTRHFRIIKNNYACRISELNSIASIFPHHLVRDGMKYGVFKTEDYSHILQNAVITADNTPVTSPITRQLQGMHQPTFF